MSKFLTNYNYIQSLYNTSRILSLTLEQSERSLVLNVRSSLADHSNVRLSVSGALSAFRCIYSIVFLERVLAS